MEGYLGEGDRLKNRAVAVDGEVRGDSADGHGFDGGLGGGATGEMNDEGAADGERSVAGELDFFGDVQPGGRCDEHGLGC